MSHSSQKGRNKRAAVLSTATTGPQKPRQAGPMDIAVNGVRVELSPELEAAVRRAYEGSTEPLPREMTTTQAAAFLDVSRPFVVKLIQRGELPCRLVGTHRRIPSQALRAYREKMFQRARLAADDMTQLSQELGLYDSKVPTPKTR